MYEFLEYRVDDFMTFPVVTIGEHATLAEAQEVFTEHDFNSIPVTEDDRLLGVLTKLDVLNAFAFSEDTMVPPYAQILRQEVSTVMTRDPVTVETDAPLTRVIQTMVKTRFKSFPVIRGGGVVVGMIAREDIGSALKCAAAGEGADALRAARTGSAAKRPSFFEEVARRLGRTRGQAEGLTLAVFQELRDRLTLKEAADVAAQLPRPLKRIWLENEHAGRQVRRIHREEFLGRVRRRAGLPDDVEAERVVRVVFRALQRILGSVTGTEGESWDVFSELPKDLKTLWLEAGAYHLAHGPAVLA